MPSPGHIVGADVLIRPHFGAPGRRALQVSRGPTKAQRQHPQGARRIRKAAEPPTAALSLGFKWVPGGFTPMPPGRLGQRPLQKTTNGMRRRGGYDPPAGRHMGRPLRVSRNITRRRGGLRPPGVFAVLYRRARALPLPIRPDEARGGRDHRGYTARRTNRMGPPQKPSDSTRKGHAASVKRQSRQRLRCGFCGERTIPPVRGKCPTGTKGVGTSKGTQ